MEFKDVKFMTAKEKDLTIKAWERFVKNGFMQKDFTKRVYHHLNQHCSFIAHYDLWGFYNTYFINPASTRQFISQFDSDKGCISIEYGTDLPWYTEDYRDINQAMVDVMGKYKVALYQLLNDKEREMDITKGSGATG